MNEARDYYMRCCCTRALSPELGGSPVLRKANRLNSAQLHAAPMRIGLRRMTHDLVYEPILTTRTHKYILAVLIYGFES